MAPQSVSGFTNLTQHAFTNQQLNILRKGPSYIPPPRRVNKATKTRHTAEVQACYDRAVKWGKDLATQPAFTELLCGVHRITQSAYRKPSSVAAADNQIHSAIKGIQSLGIPVMPSDKTKRLVALEPNNYAVMLANALNPDDEVVRGVLPLTRQNKFNSELGAIANRYRGTNLYRVLANCKTSEPLPSQVYALPKDHKEGEIKGRPIVSTLHSATRPLSQLVARVLNPLIRSHVPAHLGSTLDFVECVNNQKLEHGWSFGSLDVSNLYGSIQLQDDNNGARSGLISVVTRFFMQHRHETDLMDLEVDDFKRILQLVLGQDVYLLNGECRSQKRGIAMGNCAAPPLAIIFMDAIERHILGHCADIKLWKRYIDDVFYVTAGAPQDLLSLANSANPYIQFTLEVPSENQLGFLDTLVSVDPINSTLQLQLYFKPSHSGTCLPFESSVPISRKRCLIHSETLRAQRNASNDQLRTRNLAKVDKRLKMNGYSKTFIQKTRLGMANRPKANEAFVTYLRVPYLSEPQTHAIKKLQQRTGMNDKVRLIFETEKPLSRQFRPLPETPVCPKPCISCDTAEKPNCCYRKNVIYKITCSLCGAVYIGQTERTVRSRIIEHCKTTNSHVHMHMMEHGPGRTTSLQWRLLATHHDTSTRLAMESLYIKAAENKMNGCEGARILPVLK
jgi:hypothetical protein